ncbi:hypothetical protein [Pseudomonas abietaniphila]|uniref:Uncharacterized protein n=1 Tax=Pseudomonas abietaniphila TaxID=89065 RepID=A0A1G8KAG5_9PSED|nr:hypothetical protein [Pseudomonas abietaniphila]SDI40377.1 hypothetical protein SAMN05216605_11328 [Pseudomonas abietaniphila]
MKIGPLTLFSHNPTALLIAALHWQGSITWRWALNWRHTNQLIPYGFGSTRHYKSSPGWNGVLTLNLPVLGYFHLQAQPNKFQPGWKAYS